MWLVKGVLFGLLASLLFTVIYFRGIIGPIRQDTATGLSVIASGFSYPPYWVVIAATMVTSCLWARVLHMAFARV